MSKKKENKSTQISRERPPKNEGPDRPPPAGGQVKVWPYGVVVVAAPAGAFSKSSTASAATCWPILML